MLPARIKQYWHHWQHDRWPWGRTQRSYSLSLLRQQPFWLGSLVATATLLGISMMGGLEQLELQTYDVWVRLQPDLPPDPRLLVVEVTEADIRQQNQWPLSDETLAQVLAKLQTHHPLSIGLDLYRDIDYPPGEKQLKAQLQKSNVFGIEFFGDLETTNVPAPATMAPEQIGFNDLSIDQDGVARRQLLFVALGDEVYYSLSLRLALHALAQDPSALHQPLFEPMPSGLVIGGKRFPVITPQAGGYQNADSTGYQTLLRYRSQRPATRRVTLSDLLSDRVNPEWVKDKIVLIGVTAPSLKDLLPTPYSASIQDSNYLMPGVEVHAQMLSQILSVVAGERSLLQFWPEPLEWAWIWLWAMLGGWVGWRFKHPLSVGAAGFAGLLLLGGGTVLLFASSIWIPGTQPAIAFLFNLFVLVTYRGFYTTFHDPLTGLPNQLMFLRYLRQTLKRQQTANSSTSPSTSAMGPAKLAVLFLDLDRFQVINERFGHQMGDQVLLTITHRLKRENPNQYRLARLGGDEFALLLDGMSSSQEACDFVDHLQKQLSQPIAIGNEQIVATASVGIALGQSDYTYEPEGLLRDAHTATYRAKSLGKARYEVFSTGMRAQVVNRFQIETDLYKVLERQELFLEYQPLVCLTTGTIAGFEALVRWNHPERGRIPPGEFIPVAEETNFIIPMGQWILATACHQAQVWQQQFPRCKSLIMSVNLSPQQFKQANLVHQIREILLDSKLEGRCLKLELTESMVMGDVDAAIQVLLKLKALQIKLGLDDFGTGYSSLSYLHRFPLDTLKIDRSFVMQMEEASENREIVKTIVALGHNLGMDIIAEGVETEVQARSLQGLNCEYGQGYFFAHPLSAADATAALAQEQLWPTKLEPTDSIELIN